VQRRATEQRLDQFLAAVFDLDFVHGLAALSRF
jgi:hypothetical protein